MRVCKCLFKRQLFLSWTVLWVSLERQDGVTGSGVTSLSVTRVPDTGLVGANGDFQ